VPILDRQLAGDQRGASADAFIQQFEQVIAFSHSRRRDNKYHAALAQAAGLNWERIVAYPVLRKSIASAARIAG
jgi:hypothetical protein